MGGIKHKLLNEITRDIWERCQERNIWIYAEYIASKDNFQADEQSREYNIDTEWELAEFAFDQIENKFGPFDIDLFASRTNKKCTVYCSWQRDAEAAYINAFTIDWRLFRWYSFPPFSLIPRVLRKIRDEKTTGVLVVPYWPSQAWFPVFQQMLIAPPTIFQPSSNLLLSPCREIQHPLASSLSLIAGVLCGKV